MSKETPKYTVHIKVKIIHDYDTVGEFGFGCPEHMYKTLYEDEHENPTLQLKQMLKQTVDQWLDATDAELNAAAQKALAKAVTLADDPKPTE